MQELEDKSFKSTRRQYVAKRNDLVQRTRRSLTMVESKALSYILSKVKPEDTPNTVYRFDCDEFCRLLHWDTQSYKRIKHVLWDIASQTFIIVDTCGTEKFAHWFNLVHLKSDGAPRSESDIRGRYIEITIHQDLMQYVFDLRGQSDAYYTMYRLQNIVLMKHPYSQSLYELLKSYQNGKSFSRWTFEIGTGTTRDIQMLLAMYKKVPVDTAQGKMTARSTYHKDGDTQEYTLVPVLPSSWKKYTFFERDVIKPSVEEINRYTDIIVDYKAEKMDLQRRKTRRYSTITFFISAKSSSEQTQTDSVIDAEYEDEDVRQITLADYSADFRAKREKDIAEAQQKIKAEADEKHRVSGNEQEEQMMQTEYSIIYDALSEHYSVKEIGFLLKAAQEHWYPGCSSWDARSLWLCDYIEHYDAMVQATSEDTRTTNYRRLLNMLSKDYDDFAEALEVKYKVPDKNTPESAEEDGAEMTDKELEEKIRQLQEELQKRRKE